MRSQFTLPLMTRSCFSLVARNPLIVMKFLPMSFAAISCGCQMVIPLGLSTSNAILAKRRFAEMPMRHLIC